MTGLDRDNASTAQLIGTSDYEVYLHLWNLQDAQGQLQMHGDVEFKLYGVLPAIGGGVCIGNPIEEVVQSDTPIELTGEDGEPLPIEEALLI